MNLRSEILGGVTTFLAMAYIVVVNPSILATEGTGMSFSGVLTATVLLCFTMTLLMGLYAKLPFGVAPGMGINAYFTFTVILGQQVAWPVALGIVFWAGVLFLITSVTPIREMERDMILRALEETGQDKRRAAQLLGISLKTLYNKLAKYGIQAVKSARLT